jgi:L-asparaginase
VAGIVITHGTDTLEETAYFLHRVLAPNKPVVLTAAMRPAGALAADGPQNLLDSVRLAAWPGSRGVVACMAGAVHAGHDVRKAHPYRQDAFDSGDAGPLGYMEEGRLRQLRDWPQGDALGLACVQREFWPRVDIVMNHAGADGTLVDALVALGARGIVAAGTGNGTLADATRNSPAARAGKRRRRAARQSNRLRPNHRRRRPCAARRGRTDAGPGTHRTAAATAVIGAPDDSRAISLDKRYRSSCDALTLPARALLQQGH